MTAAGISAAGPKGALRAQALTLMYVRVLSVWANDEDPGLARTMAALDRELARVLHRLEKFAGGVAKLQRAEDVPRRAARHAHGEREDPERTITGSERNDHACMTWR